MVATTLPFDARALAVLISYLVLCLCVGGLGFCQKKRQREESVQDHFLAGTKGLPMPVLVGTLLAQTLSGWSLLGYPAVAYREGLGALRWMTASVMIYVGWIVITPRLYHVGRERRWITPADFCKARFGRGALHCLLTCTTLAPTVLYVLIQFKGISTSIAALSAGHIAPQVGAVIASFVMLCYDFLGGMRSVAWLDCVQAVLMLTSFFVLLALTNTLFGGLSNAMVDLRLVSPERTATPDASGLRRHWSTCVLMLSFAIYPHQVSRTFAATSGRGLRGAGAVMALHPFVSQGLCLVLGWAATPALLGELDVANSDDLLLVVMARLMDVGQGGYWVSVLLMCALVAAMMSTADSGLMAIAAMLSNDLVASYTPRPLGVRRQLLIAKSATFLACVVIVLITTVDINLVHLAALQQQILSQALPTLWLGLHVPSVRANSLLVGLIVGLATFVIVLAAGIAGGGNFGYLWCGIHPGCWGLAANLLAVGVGQVMMRGGPCRGGGRGSVVDESVHAQLFGDGTSGGGTTSGAARPPPTTLPPGEPSRRWWFGVGVIVLTVPTAPFWRAAGEQDAIAAILPRWADISLLFSSVLGLALAAVIRLSWQLPPAATTEERTQPAAPEQFGSSRGKPRPARASSQRSWWRQGGKTAMPAEVSLSSTSCRTLAGAQVDADGVAVTLP